MQFQLPDPFLPLFSSIFYEIVKQNDGKLSANVSLLAGLSGKLNSFLQVPRLAKGYAYAQEKINGKYSLQIINSNHGVHVSYASQVINMKNVKEILNTKLISIFNFHRVGSF